MTPVLRLCDDAQLTSREGAPVEPPLGAKTLALLAYLALEPRAHRREHLATLLWGESPDEKAKASLRQALTQLREALGDALRVDRSSVQLAVPLECDVLEFMRASSLDPDLALSIDVTRFLEGLTLRNCPGFEEWADDRRADLRSRYVALLATRAREALARRDWREAGRLADRWSELAPLTDDPVAIAMEARFLDGDREGALATHERHVGRLSRAGEHSPGRTLSELAARIQRGARAGLQPRASTAMARPLAPSFAASLVGRANEWEALRLGWKAVVKGMSRTVLVEGEPGVGKTRLVDDFLRWVTSEGGIVLRGRGYDAHGGAPFGAVIEALESALDAPGLAGVDPEWLTEVARVLPALRTRFPGLPEGTNHGAAADGWRLFEGVAQLLLAIAEESPVAMMIDDLQWCDADSCGLLHFLVRRVAGSRVMWCATFTVGEVERDAPAARLSRALRAGSSATSLTLAPLTEEDVWRMIRELARVDAPNGARKLAGRIHEVTAGNPFYVIELLKTLFAQDVLSIDAASDAWIARHANDGGSVPLVLAPTVHDAVADRIERLSDDQRAVLISVAASGRGCRTEVLSHMHGISRLHAAMLGDALVERHLVVEEDGRYRCAHPTIADVVRARLSTSRHREVHRGLALSLELVLGEGGVTGIEVGEIASHAEQAGDRRRAYRYAMLASEAADQRSAYDEALSWLDLATASADDAEQSGAVDQLTARVLERAGWREAPAVRAPISLVARRMDIADLDLPARETTLRA